MKSKHCIGITALIAVLSIIHLPLSYAEEDHASNEDLDEEFEEKEIPFPTEKQTLEFMRKEIPVSIEILELILKEEGKEQHAAVLSDFRNQYHEYLDIKHYDGPEAAKLVLDGINLELQMDKALHEFHQGEEGNGQLEKRIHELVRKQWEHSRKAMRMELKLIDLHRAEVQAELKELDAMGEQDLKSRAAELLELEEDE